MQRINISEQDLTTNSNEVILADRVFIPGFAVNSESEDYIGIPVDCDTLEEFNTIFLGAEDPQHPGYYFEPVFASNQDYPEFDTTEQSTTTYGFDTKAVPHVTSSSGIDTKIMYVINECDPSYAYARELLSAGIPISYMRMNSKSYTWTTGTGGVVSRTFPNDYDVTVVNAYTQLSTVVYNYNTSSSIPTYVSPLMSIDDVNVKFLTSGGYPVIDYFYDSVKHKIAQQMAHIAAFRGDCVALLDHTNNPTRNLTGNDSVFGHINNETVIEADTHASFAATFTPWCTLTSGEARPASYMYIKSYAKSNLYAKNWLAIAGVNRGLVNITNLRTSKILTNTIAEYYQREASDTTITKSINAITYIKPNGYCIWGNRTLVNTSAAAQQGFATSFLNLRNLVSDVKKQARYAAKQCLFEQNNDIMWINFKGYITPLLDSMVSGNMLKGYKIIKGETADKQKVVANIRIYPIYSVESFDITVTVTDEDEVTTTE